MNTEHFKKKLQEEMSVLDKAIKENSGIGMSEDATASEKDEVADKIEDIEEGRSENTALIARRESVRSALDKISKGGYGVCEVGGEPIEEDRLEADPAARTCKKHM